MTSVNYSFGQWCLDNNRQDLIDRWDNERDIFDVAYKSNLKFSFKCPRGLHENTSSNLYDLSEGKKSDVFCKKCGSFGQWMIDRYGEEYLWKIWSDKNTISPFDVSTHSSKRCWFVCQKDKEHIYDMALYHYTSGVGCPYCSHQRILPKDSLAVKAPKVIDLWSDKNKKSPYEYSISSGRKVWWKCDLGIHEDYQRTIANSIPRDYKCPICGMERSHIREREDLTGMKFNKLTVLRLDEEKSKEKKKSVWVCKCDCGNIISVDSWKLKCGNTKTCGDRTVHYSGENCGNWKGGATPKYIRIRTSKSYNAWRDAVYKKCWYTCQCCGQSKNINKEAHHFLNFSSNEDLRFDVNNGILLCSECHIAVIEGGFHYIYGHRDNTPEQLEEYINNKRKILGINELFSYEEYQRGKIVHPGDFSVYRERENY